MQNRIPISPNDKNSMQNINILVLMLFRRLFNLIVNNFLILRYVKRYHILLQYNGTSGQHLTLPDPSLEYATTCKGTRTIVKGTFSCKQLLRMKMVPVPYRTCYFYYPLAPSRHICTAYNVTFLENSV
jgi:hypothetical protein